MAGTAVIVELAERWRIGVWDGAPLVSHRAFAGGLTCAGCAPGSVGRLRFCPPGSVGRASSFPRIRWALRRLDATGGLLPIGELRRELGCSRRHLSARFAAGVGVTRSGTRSSCASARPGEVAVACGYADQAHLTREVRRFGTTTPGALVAGT